MLERIREGSQGVVAKSILGLVIITFAISGIGSYISSQADSAVATVNDVEITKTDFEQAYQSERARMESQYGEVVQQLMADESYVQNFRKGVLDRLIVEELQRQQAIDLGIRVGDQQIKDAIVSMPEFQRDGQFNNDIYQALLRQAGFQPAEFREYMRQQMSRNQYAGAILATEFVTPAEAKTFAKLSAQTRSFDLLSLNTNDFVNQVSVTDEDLETYYQGNLFQYMTDEKVAVSYLVLDKQAMAANINVTEQDLRDYYEQNIDQYTTRERRKLSHILIDFGDDKAAAQQKAAQLKQRISDGESFAELAKTESADTFSAEQGGNLDWLEPGTMGQSFDDAAFALSKVGQVSDVVETEFGFHLIQATEIVAQQQQAFAEVRDAIAENYQENKATELYFDAQTKVMELAFEQPDNLQDAASAANLAVNAIELTAAAELPAPLNNPTVITKLFDQDFIAEGLNSDLLEIEDGLSVVVRVTDHQRPQQQTLEQVKQQVEQAVRFQKAREMVTEQGQQYLAKLQQGQSLQTLASGVERKANVERFATGLPREVVTEVFALAKPADKPVVALVDTANGVALISMYAVTDSDNVEVNKDEPQLAMVINRLANQLLVESLKESAEIKINTNI